VAVKIKLKRMGKIRTPQYRIVVADARTKRDGKAIEEIGKYHPKEEPSFIEVNSERAQHWLSVGAQPTGPVKTILKRTGDWQKFKGLTEPAPLKVAEPRDKEAEEAAFQAVLKELVLPENDTKGGESKGRGRKSSGASEKKADKADKADKAEKSEKAEKSDAAPATENTGEETTTEPEGEV
jgi:small subunit ribosomal protein S16